MTNILLYIIIISIILLLGFIIYYYLSKMPQKGKAEISLKVMLGKILKIEFKSKYYDDSKVKQ